jgi:hypothetical protein
MFYSTIPQYREKEEKLLCYQRNLGKVKDNLDTLLTLNVPPPVMQVRMMKQRVTLLFATSDLESCIAMLVSGNKGHFISFGSGFKNICYSLFTLSLYYIVQ